MPVSNCPVNDSDDDQNMDTVSLQAVTLSDGSTAYIPHNTQGMCITVPPEQQFDMLKMSSNSASPI